LIELVRYVFFHRYGFLQLGFALGIQISPSAVDIRPFRGGKHGVVERIEILQLEVGAQGFIAAAPSPPSIHISPGNVIDQGTQ
jgi:hypothetical protein